MVLDRYVYSNVGFQCAKLPAGERRDRLAQWILDLEFGYNDLPRPDLSLFLDVPFAFTERKLTEVREGDDRDYLQGSRDIHEDALDLQRRVREVYLARRGEGRFAACGRLQRSVGGDGFAEHNFEKIRAVLAPILDAR